MNRFVVATNVIVSGVITAETTAAVRVLEQMLTGGVPFVLSPDLIRHYEAVLNRPALRNIHGLHRSQVDTLVTTLASSAMIRDPQPSTVRVTEPADQYLIDLVMSDTRFVLVAGDTRLHRSKLDVSIVSPAGVMKLFDDRYGTKRIPTPKG